MPTVNCQNDPGWNEDTEMNVSVLFEFFIYILLMCFGGCLTDIFDPFVCDNQSFHVSAREKTDIVIILLEMLCLDVEYFCLYAWVDME